MNHFRSVFFVPGDSDKKLAKARQIPADVMIYDLEDSVLPDRRPLARELVTAELTATRGEARVRAVRINALDTTELSTGDALQDLAAVVRAAPDLIMLPKVRSVNDIVRLSTYLDVLEVREDLAAGNIKILAVVTETPQIMFAHGGLQQAGERLVAMTWGAEDLSTALGASTNKGTDGNWGFTYQMARSQCLMAAKACGVQAIDTLYADFRSEAGLVEACTEARRDGFTGKIAIHPNQVEAINTAFTPSAEEVEFAQQVVATFEANPGAGVVQLDGKMLDIPHLKQAHQVLQQAAQYR
ncbi:CoA ester lyase [Pseudomaricurvus alkylphenolicus]|uniref:HpcH/HpaI aldolase/citrate lyase family protein n=1 Tax=Pseudomaricurvus alkylphenolicus TaxID=1306991 RepID=UPI001423E607|nr:CoA ester lyase [Pseudomaricurvus alkylphenolicus]NIB38868.1 CoA ester lyase [Pseudomaricurvus alkylphenolicus]